MLKLADVTITHGGKGTIYHSLIEGVPIFGIPQQAEQEINLKRIKQINLGDYILASNLPGIDNDELEKKINSVISSKRMHNNAIRLSNKIRKEMASIDKIVLRIHKKIN